MRPRPPDLPAAARRGVQLTVEEDLPVADLADETAETPVLEVASELGEQDAQLLEAQQRAEVAEQRARAAEMRVKMFEAEKKTNLLLAFVREALIGSIGQSVQGESAWNPDQAEAVGDEVESIFKKQAFGTEAASRLLFGANTHQLDVLHCTLRECIKQVAQALEQPDVVGYTANQLRLCQRFDLYVGGELCLRKHPDKLKIASCRTWPLANVPVKEEDPERERREQKIEEIKPVAGAIVGYYKDRPFDFVTTFPRRASGYKPVKASYHRLVVMNPEHYFLKLHQERLKAAVDAAAKK